MLKVLRESKYTVSVVIIYLFVLFYFFIFTLSPWSVFVFNKTNLVMFFPIAVCTAGSLFLANKLLKFGELRVNKKNLLQFSLIFFCAFVLIAVPEEIIFRGFVQKYLQSVILNPSLSIIFSALVFGAAHLLNGALGFWPGKWNWKLAGMSFIAGLYLGLAYFLTDSLVPPIILHTLILVVVKIFVKD